MHGDPSDQLRAQVCQAQRDKRTKGVATDEDGVQVKGLNQRREIVDVLMHGPLGRRAFAAAVTPPVVCHDPAVLGEQRQNLRPVVRITPGTVDHDDAGPFAVNDLVK